jgi:hypothetical protein
VQKDHGQRKGFLDGYKRYDASTGRGNAKDWQIAFLQRLGLSEARRSLGLPADAGWDEVRQVFRLAATESLSRLVAGYEEAVRAFGSAGPVEEKAEAVKGAKYRIEAYVAYLDEQRRKLESERERITETLRTRITNF